MCVCKRFVPLSVLGVFEVGSILELFFFFGTCDLSLHMPGVLGSPVEKAYKHFVHCSGFQHKVLFLVKVVVAVLCWKLLEE